MREIYRKAIPEAIKALGGKANFLKEMSGYDTYQISNKKWGCEIINGNDNCAIIVRTLKPNTGNAPTWLGGKPSYVFNEFGSYHNTVQIGTTNNLVLPENEIYAAVSKALPKWTYLYFAPNKVKLANGKKIPYNYLLDDGKPLFFIYPNA